MTEEEIQMELDRVDEEAYWELLAELDVIERGK